jgi:hypothetical protein
MNLEQLIALYTFTRILNKMTQYFSISYFLYNNELYSTKYEYIDDFDNQLKILIQTFCDQLTYIGRLLSDAEMSMAMLPLPHQYRCGQLPLSLNSPWVIIFGASDNCHRLKNDVGNRPTAYPWLRHWVAV